MEGLENLVLLAPVAIHWECYYYIGVTRSLHYNSFLPRSEKYLFCFGIRSPNAKIFLKQYFILHWFIVVIVLLIAGFVKFLA